MALKGTIGAASAGGPTTGFSGGAAVATLVAPPAHVKGTVQLWSPDTRVSVTAKHWERPQITQERAGGWTAVDRPGLLPVSWWDGPQALKLRLVLFIDGYNATPKRHVEAELEAIRSFGYRVPALKRPPVVYVVGRVPYAEGGVLEAYKSIPPRWVVDALDVEGVLSTSTGKTARAKVTVDLLEYAPADTDVRRAQSTKSRAYTWKKGDSLRKVARDELGSPDRTDLIRKANPKVNFPKLKPGAKITIPGVAS